MKRVVGGMLALLLALPALGADDKSKDKPALPAQQYQALVKEYQDAQQALRGLGPEHGAFGIRRRRRFADSFGNH